MIKNYKYIITSQADSVDIVFNHWNSVNKSPLQYTRKVNSSDWICIYIPIPTLTLKLFNNTYCLTVSWARPLNSSFFFSDSWRDNCVFLNSFVVYGEVFSIQHYVIKFVSDLQQFRGFQLILLSVCCLKFVWHFF
jgi:hypothetical protein